MSSRYDSVFENVDASRFPPPSLLSKRQGSMARRSLRSLWRDMYEAHCLVNRSSHACSDEAERRSECKWLDLCLGPSGSVSRDDRAASFPSSRLRNCVADDAPLRAREQLNTELCSSSERLKTDSQCPTISQSGRWLCSSATYVAPVRCEDQAESHTMQGRRSASNRCAEQGATTITCHCIRLHLGSCAAHDGPVLTQTQIIRPAPNGEKMSTPHHRPPRSSNLAKAQGSSTTQTATQAAVKSDFFQRPWAALLSGNHDG